MNKTLMKLRTTTEPIFILIKWGAGKKKKQNITNQKKCGFPREWKNLNIKTFTSKKANRATVIGSKQGTLQKISQQTREDICRTHWGFLSLFPCKTINMSSVFWQRENVVKS